MDLTTNLILKALVCCYFVSGCFESFTAIYMKLKIFLKKKKDITAKLRQSGHCKRDGGG